MTVWPAAWACREGLSAIMTTSSAATQNQPPLTLGHLLICTDKQATLHLPNVGSGLVVVMYDRINKVAGAAHILLPDSNLDANTPGNHAASADKTPAPAKFANLAIPTLIQQFEAGGGQKTYTSVRLAGGAQLFNFGGGGGNPLNIGSRNAIAARANFTRLGYPVEKADIGGNKARTLKLVMQSGQLSVTLLGGREYFI